MNRHLALLGVWCLLVVLFPSRILSQQNGGSGSANVSGTVYMEKDNRPIFSAYVRLCDAGGTQVAEMFTSDSGEFALLLPAPTGGNFSSSTTETASCSCACRMVC